MEIYHMLTLGLLVLSFAILLFVRFSNRKRGSINNYAIKEEDSQYSEEVKYTVKVIDSWINFNNILLTLHHFFNIMSIYCSVITAYVGSANGENSDIVLYSVLAITFLFADLLLRPKELGYGYRIAYQDAAYTLQQYFCGLKKWDAVLRIVNEGEKKIGQSFYGQCFTDGDKNYEAEIQTAGFPDRHGKRDVRLLGRTVVADFHIQHRAKRRTNRAARKRGRFQRTLRR